MEREGAALHLTFSFLHADQLQEPVRSGAEFLDLTGQGEHGALMESA
jgi:hypothetical protein